MIPTVPSMHRFSLMAPQQPKKPTNVTKAPAAIRILADTEYPAYPRSKAEVRRTVQD